MEIPLNIFENCQIKKELKKNLEFQINFQKVVPMLVEGDFTLGESRAIMMYLAERDGVEHKIYPRDPKIRALINSRLLFDQGTLYQRFVDYYYPQIFSKKPALPEKYKMFEQALGHLDTFLENSKFVAGDQLSLADLSIFTSCSTYKISAGIDLGKYSNISRWYDECENVLPGMDFDRKGAEVFRKLFELIET